MGHAPQGVQTHPSCPTPATASVSSPPAPRAAQTGPGSLCAHRQSFSSARRGRGYRQSITSRRAIRSAQKCRKSPRNSQGTDETRALEVRQHERPDRASSLAAGGIDIEDAQLALATCGFADDMQIRHRRSRGASRHPEPRLSKLVPQVRRRGRDDLRQSRIGCLCERRIPLTLDPPGAEHQCFEPLLAEHQGRPEESGAQQVADTCRALDRRAEKRARLHVPVDGPHRDREFFGQTCRADRPTPAAQRIHQVDQPGGPVHCASAWSTLLSLPLPTTRGAGSTQPVRGG